MIIIPESLTFIIAGKWNIYILSHDWVARNIFKDDQINVEFSMDQDLPLRYHKNSIRFIPANNSVTFQALKDEDEILNNIEEKAKSLVSELDKTPIQAFGINISYKEDNPSPDILKLFKFDDVINEKNDIIKSEIKRTLKLTSETVLNLTTSLLEDMSFTVGFNFHTISLTSKDFINYFSQKDDVIKGFIKISKEIMKDIYKLEITHEEINSDK